MKGKAKRGAKKEAEKFEKNAKEDKLLIENKKKGDQEDGITNTSKTEELFFWFCYRFAPRRMWDV